MIELPDTGGLICGFRLRGTEAAEALKSSAAESLPLPDRSRA
jgi:hypothetical protein